jgi:hypothetical protein
MSPPTVNGPSLVDIAARIVYIGAGEYFNRAVDFVLGSTICESQFPILRALGGGMRRWGDLEVAGFLDGPA